MADQPKDAPTPKPTESSQNISRGEGSVADVQNVADDAAEGHPPPVKPQPTPSQVNVNVTSDKR